MEILFYFFVYAIAGWICEDIYCGIGQRKFVNRGFLYGPYCPIYGFGSLIVIYLLSPFYDHPLLVFIGGVIFTSLLEYLTSWIMEVLFQERWWDYSSYPFNINGRVCLRNSLLFGVMAFVLMYLVHPHVYHLYHSLPFTLMRSIIIVVTCLFILDIILTVRHLLKRKNVTNDLIKSLENAKLQFEAEENKNVQLHREAFINWAKANPEIAAKLISLKKFENTHVSKAFPDRILFKKEMHELIKAIKDKQ